MWSVFPGESKAAVALGGSEGTSLRRALPPPNILQVLPGGRKSWSSCSVQAPSVYLPEVAAVRRSQGHRAKPSVGGGNSSPVGCTAGLREMVGGADLGYTK